MGRNSLISDQAKRNIENENVNEKSHNARTTKRDVRRISSLGGTLKFRHSFRDEYVDEQFRSNISMNRRTNENRADHVEICLQNHANFIVSKMEKDLSMMRNKVESEMYTKETLKHMAQCLTVKRSVKRKLTESMVKPKGRPISLWKRMKYRMSIKYSLVKFHLKDMFYSFEFWNDSLKTIEGQFGSGTMSYFKFLRWLFLMNLTTMCFTIIFIALPELIHKNKAELKANLMTYGYWEIFTGEGSFTNSILYYGNYSAAMFNVIGIPYSMPHAYFYTMLFLYIVSVLISGYSVTQSYRISFIQAEGGLKNVFGTKIFCGWDYSITNQDAADLNSKAVYIRLKELLSEIDMKDIEIPWTRKVKVAFKRVMVFIAIFVIVALVGVFLWILMEVQTNYDIELPLIVPLLANLLNVILPNLFTKVVRYENYKKQSQAVGITLMRSFLLSAVIVGTLVTFWLTHSSKNECRETLLGQEMYRLIIWDFFLTLLIHIAHYIYFMVIRYCLKMPVNIEFDVASNTLDLIYSQSLLWVGLCFSPLLSVVVSVKIFFTWYMKKYYVLLVCQPSQKPWRASQTNTWFLTFTFMVSVITVGLMIYLIVRSSPSNCGPFRDYKHFYDIVLEIFNTGTFPLLTCIQYVTKPGAVTLVMMVLCVQVYYVKEKANGQRNMVKMLRSMIAWESKDKKFLLERISNVTRGEWQYNLKENRDDDPFNSVPKTVKNQDFEIGNTGASTSSNYTT